MPMEEEVHNTRRFSYAHLLAATENFSDSRKIGQGAFGAVYKAQLMNWTTPVAVKRIMRVADHERAARDYDNEIKVISKLSHPNLVPFVGSCDENGELLLVYDLIHNGTLDYHLHYANTILSWGRRYKIALGMASALNYMHGNHPRVLHRDIKPGNVMLDEEFNAKVGDFGLVRQVPIDKTSCPMTIFGSSRYIDPQYCSTGCISPASDIYSFGVVLLEIASGEIPQCLKGNGLVEKFRRLYYSNSLLDAVDRRLNGDFDEEQMKRVILIGLLCVQFDHHMRPSMARREALLFGGRVAAARAPVRLARRGVSAGAEAGGSSSAAAAAQVIGQDEAVEWVKKDRRRMLHVVYRVGDLDKTIKFYTECLGMKLLRKRDIPEERYTNAFLGYGPEDSHFVVELTYNYGVESYDIGTAFGHFGIAVEDVAKTVDLIKAKGGTVTREPGPVKGGKSVIAFIEDPDGYKFELIERGPTPEPLCQVMLRVGDLDHAINFYEKAFGMELLRKRDNPQYKYTIAMMGYGPEDKNAVLELTYNYGVKEYDKGNAYAQIAISTDDVYKTAEVIRQNGGQITREPGPLPGINTKITACTDPDGWKTVFVDNVDFLKELEE
ncbi:hypothetical protein OsI_19060 [Oryza sativa Indica Group]|nr:hypothetical protein OsI_19060 [Oryza sativa Indica Group]